MSDFGASALKWLNERTRRGSKSSRARLVLSAMLTGKIIVQDDIKLTDPTQKIFVEWTAAVMKGRSFSLQDITLDVADPERWLIKTGG